MRNLYWSGCSLDVFDDVVRISLPKASRAHAETLFSVQFLNRLATCDVARRGEAVPRLSVLSIYDAIKTEITTQVCNNKKPEMNMLFCHAIGW
jgi:hypothetical protein